ITGGEQVPAAYTTELAFAAGGRGILTLQSGAARSWDFPSGKLQREFSHSEVHKAALSPDGRRLATSSFNHGLRLWDTESGRELMKLIDKGSQEGRAREFVFTQDGRRLCAWEADFRLRAWDVATGRLVAEHMPRPDGFPKDFDDEDDRVRRRRGGIKEIHHLASISGFSPDGSRFYWL